MLPRSLLLAHLYISDCCCANLFETTLPKYNGSTLQTLSPLSLGLGVIERMETSGALTPNPDFLCVLKAQPGQDLDGCMALDLTDHVVWNVLDSLRHNPPEIWLLSQALPSLICDFNSNTAQHAASLIGKPLELKRFNLERSGLLRTFLQDYASWKSELRAIFSISRSTGDLYSTALGSVFVESIPVQFSPAFPTENDTADSLSTSATVFAAENAPWSPESSQTGGFPNWVFYTEPELGQSNVDQHRNTDSYNTSYNINNDNNNNTTNNYGSDENLVQGQEHTKAPLPNIAKEVIAQQCMDATLEILLEFARNMATYYSGEGIAASGKVGRRGGKVQNLLWPGVVVELNKLQRSGKAGYADRLQVLTADVWQLALEKLEQTKPTAAAGILLRVPSLESLSCQRKSSDSKLQADLEVPTSLLEGFAVVILRILMSKQWKFTSSAVMFWRSLAIGQQNRREQVKMFVHYVTSWFLVLYPPHKTHLILPVLTNNETHLFANKKHFWKFAMLPDDNE